MAVRGDRHADAAAAHEDAAARPSFGDGARERIAEVESRKTQRLELGGESGLEIETGMIRGDRDEFGHGTQATEERGGILPDFGALYQRPTIHRVPSGHMPKQ